MSVDRKSIAILGAGAWGTALAIQAANLGHAVFLWAYELQQIHEVNTQHYNSRYLPNVCLSSNIICSHDIEQVVRRADLVCIATPSAVFRQIVCRIQPFLQQRSIAWVTKGLEPDTHQWLHEVVVRELGEIEVAVLSGPSFAREVASNIVTAVMLASSSSEFARVVRDYFQSAHFLIYISHDVIGVELGGAIKNVLAIALGIVDGLGLGANTRAAFITFGLAEMLRLGVALGAQTETLLGLSGCGDLILTCTDDQSRNRRFGIALGQSMSIQQAKEQVASVVEGIETSAGIFYWLQKKVISAPICDTVYRILYQGLPVQALLQCLNTMQHVDF